MTFKYNYIPLDQLHQGNTRVLLKEGNCSFKVRSAVQKTSRNMNEMIELELDCTDSEGQHGRVWDYLLDNQAWKINAFLNAIGYPKLYGQPLDCNFLIGKQGQLRVKVEQKEGYSPKNVPNGYIEHQGMMDVREQGPAIDDDDIPF